MQELKQGAKIPMESGGEAEVLKKLGSGGQGVVYRVRFNGKEYALKWYDPDKLAGKERFRENLRRNIADGPPSDAFLWPGFLTAEHGGSFGYLMNIRPSGYSEFSDILNTRDKDGNRVVFSSLRAIADCALNIVNGFRELHRKGKSYQDLNDGNFFVDVRTGGVLICDNDNVAPDRENLGIGGKPGYMAPEIVRGESRPETLTDQHSIAVILFKLLLRHDPLMGKKYVKCVCITEEAEKELYGTNPVFIFDPDDTSNEPVPGVHPNPIKLRPLCPDYIHDAFVKSFCEGMKEPGKRLTGHEWQKLLIRLRDSIITCSCGHEMFIHTVKPSGGVFKCAGCGMDCSVPMRLELQGYPVLLFPQNKLYGCHTERDSDDYRTVTGEVVRNRKNPGLWGVRNLSEKPWSVRTPDGAEKVVSKGEVAPVAEGVVIGFTNVTGTIKEPLKSP
jgi:serine/threonine protein kinase